MSMILRKGNTSEANVIWNILQEAIEQRKLEGSRQWQDGYPNEQTVDDDIAKGYAYVLVDENLVLAYVALIFDGEPAYEVIEGKWLTHGDYVAVHRVATSNAAKGKGVATRLLQLLEPFCLERKVHSIKLDTNFDNPAMLKILNKLNYTYCGEIFFKGASRKAYEKIVMKQ
jgi:GNAT superfamily N-acetyltransferase